ncbi:18383_t:CDS:1, partial [Funneliformis geosporum]
EIISSRYQHLSSSMSIDFSADTMAFFVSGIILFKKDTEFDNWMTFPPLSFKNLIIVTS